VRLPKTSNQIGVSIAGSVGSVGGDIVGRDKVTYGIDEERLTAILERFIQRTGGGAALLSLGSPRQSPLAPGQPADPRRSPGIKAGLISQLRGALQEIVDLITDLDEDRDVDLANNRLSEWKKRTDRIVNYFFKSGNLHFQLRLYDITSDANQRTPFNKIKNESRKCQKVIADLLRELA
jgi:hypothetical protein